jgi:acetoin utilization deacetylase AcuC-like enzyme
MKIITDSRCTAYSSPGHPEKPVRISKTVERLKAQTGVVVSWDEPLPVADAIIERAHSKEHIAGLKAATADFDGDTPAYKDIFEHARRGAGGALRALQAARDGTAAFSLLRPPGHHATRDHAMGFCYLNSVAIAVLEALASGEKKVAVFDFDVHHGNGTEAVLVHHPAAAFFSIHQHPCYPGTGTDNVGKNCFNYPVSPGTPRGAYREIVTRALEDLKKAGPTLVAVSAGFDAYARDPIAQETLEAEDFWWLGKSIRDLGVPAFSVLEGGYSSDLPELILAYLKGIEGV